MALSMALSMALRHGCKGRIEAPQQPAQWQHQAAIKSKTPVAAG